MKTYHKILILSGGTAGITVAACCARKIPSNDIATIEPSDTHYYQPIWTLVDGGIFNKKKSQNDEAGLIPRTVIRKHDAVTAVEGDGKSIITCDGLWVTCDWLIVAPDIQINWGGIPGFKESIGAGSVRLNYYHQHVDYSWETLRHFNHGTAFFTHPAGAIKFGSAFYSNS